MRFLPNTAQHGSRFVLFRSFMCLSMRIIGSGSTAMFVLGVLIGLAGLVGMGLNYPLYSRLLAKGKQKYAFEIMELAKEISEA